jgi:hypothetical protein
MENILIILKDLKSKYYNHYLKYISTDLEKEIIHNTNFLPKNTILRVRIFYVENNIKSNKICKTCGKEFILDKYRLTDFCSIKCASANPDRQLKIKQTNIKKYGVENVFQFNEIKEKIKQTNLEKFGVENPNQCDEIKNKIKQTNLKKYGKESFFQTQEYKDKFKQTSLERYGVENPNQCDEIKNKVKQTNLKKYGKESFFQTQEFDNKSKETNLKRYGTDIYINSDDFKEKRKESNLEHFGVENPFQSDEIRQKIKETNIKKYGVESYTQTEEYKEKTKQTCIEKYGVESYAQTQEYKEKFKKTNLERYGVENPAQNEEIKEKTKQTCIEKFGVPSYSQTQEFKDNFKDIKLNSRIELLKDSDIEVIEYKDNLFNYKCKKCGNIWQGSYSHFYPVCRKCHPWTHSKFETEIADYIKSLGITNIITNDRNTIKPFELDILLPDFNLAIECNGVYWHSEDIIGKDYHQKKTNLCKEKGIQLIHIWEDWWNNKQDIVKSIISNKLKMNGVKIYGRNCNIKELENKESKQFLEENHIQGTINSSINLGLYYNNELVSLMTFGKSRYNKEYDWELLRFCNKKYTNIVGGASKLFNYFSKNYLNNSGILSYALMDISNGNLYSNLGFTLKGKTKPNYFYIKGMERESRIKYQKHKLKNILNIFDETLTEQENMFLNGYSVVYDSGSLIYTR